MDLLSVSIQLSASIERDSSSPLECSLMLSATREPLFEIQGEFSQAIRRSEVESFRVTQNPFTIGRIPARSMGFLDDQSLDFLRDENSSLIQFFLDGGPTDAPEVLSVGVPKHNDLLRVLQRHLHVSLNIPELWPLVDGLGEEETFARESHIKSTLKFGYEGSNAVLRSYAPGGDNSQVLASTVVMREGEGNSLQTILLVATENNMWIIPHKSGQLRNSKDSLAIIESFAWSQIADWNHHPPSWGQQTLRFMIFNRGIPPMSIDRAMAFGDSFSLRITYTWGLEDQTNFLRIAQQQIATKSAFSLVSGAATPLGREN